MYRQSLNDRISQLEASHETSTVNETQCSDPAVVNYNQAATIPKFKHKIEPTKSRGTDNQNLKPYLGYYFKSQKPSL